VRRDYPYCLHCGTIRKGADLNSFAAPQLRRGGDAGGAVPLVKTVTTVGRDVSNDVVIDDPSVSRNHARVVRGPDGFTIEDLDSFNGTTVNGRVLHGDWATLPDVATLHIGDIEVTFEQPRTTTVGSKTMVRHTATVLESPPEAVPTATEPLSVRPRPSAAWALKQVPDDRGRQSWVLRNTRTGQYLELDDRDAFIWRQIDGTNSVRDILFAYAEKYGELALPRIERTLRTLAGVGLVDGLNGQRAVQKPPLMTRVGRAIVRGLLQTRLSIGGLDRFFGATYRTVGWRFFTRSGVFGLWAVIAAGLYGFWVATGRQRLFDVGGGGAVGAVAVGAGYLIALVIHESAHALAVKSYGRKVTLGGFMLMMGMPFAFVDTSDMWFGTRWSRIVVTMSGPLSTAAIAGAAGLSAAYLPDPVVSGVAFQLAFGLYLNTLYNLNPLMPLDGYQALADALRMPRLREEATAYFTRGIWRDLRSRKRPGLRQFGLALYGLGSVFGLALFAVMGLVAWRSRLSGFVHDYVGPPLDVVLIGAGIGLVFFPLWYRLAQKVVAIRRRRASRKLTVEATA
jgi:putative peptide zinc metalloprotease protein